ncbi:MAG: YHS domain protein [Methanosaeta sp. PtaU1.Bin112]|nr:MAG: YHS domain protein [Methanosaeta sp. PtaU1.Bin112]
MAIDPMCKMTNDEKTPRLKSEYKGKMYCFCAQGCKKAFDTSPEKYLSSQVLRCSLLFLSF